jgi:hypothetical protein
MTGFPTHRIRSGITGERLAAALLLLLLLVYPSLVPPAVAVKTERWEVRSPADFMRGTLSRLIVTSEGELRLGHAAHRLDEFAKEIWSAITAADGTIYFGTGSPAEVYALGRDGAARRILQSDAIAITALALDSRGNLYAATMAEGKIYKLRPDRGDEGAEFCVLPSPYVWALTVDRQDRLLAGTGPDGQIYRIEPDGTAVEWFSAEESNILCLALDADGALLAGGSDRGLLYRISGQHTGTVLNEFGEDEVKSLVIKEDKLYIGVNRQRVRRPRPPARRPGVTDVEELTRRLTTPVGATPPAETGARERPAPPATRLANLLSGALYLRHEDGRIDRLGSWENESVLDLAVDADDGVIVAMAGEGRVYRVRSRQQWELLYDFDEQQALALAVRDGRLAFVGMGNVGAGYRIESEPATVGEFTSEVFDGQFLTRWGNLFWMGQGAIEVATRTGNTRIPDGLWTDWSEPIRESPSKIASPPARYIQLRARLSSASEPVLKLLTLHLQTQNQKPEITALEIGEQPKPAAPGRPAPTAAARSDEPSIGDRDTDATPAQRRAGARKPEEFRPRPASTTVKITWRATDPDGDPLVYRLYYQADGDSVWVPMPLREPLRKTEYTWQTESIPDGWYRVKLVASDEEANPAGQALTDERISDLHKIDNRRPEVLDLRFDPATATLSGVARDHLSLIAFLEYSVDGGDWQFFAPKDGLFDSREEPFEIQLELDGGPHFIAVRATDEEGNMGVGRITVRPPS